MPDIKGKVALITGASSGIGASTALHFASLGSWLALTARNLERLQKVADACRAKGIPHDKVLVLSGDVSVEADVASVVDKTAEHFGKIDILVNNAGIWEPGMIDASSVEDFRRMWSTNVQGPLCMIQKTLPFLRQTKGCIVNVSSISTLFLQYGASAYSMSKAALDQLTKHAALENARFGVRVNSVNPATIKTPLGKLPGFTDEEHIKEDGDCQRLPEWSLTNTALPMEYGVRKPDESNTGQGQAAGGFGKVTQDVFSGRRPFPKICSHAYRVTEGRLWVCIFIGRILAKVLNKECKILVW